VRRRKVLKHRLAGAVTALAALPAASDDIRTALELVHRYAARLQLDEDARFDALLNALADMDGEDPGPEVLHTMKRVRGVVWAVTTLDGDRAESVLMTRDEH
jgi:hypothetical protein